MVGASVVDHVLPGVCVVVLVSLTMFYLVVSVWWVLVLLTMFYLVVSM